MPSRIWKVAAVIAARIPTFLTLVLLAGLGLWGYLNDWKVPRFGGTAKEGGDEDAGETAIKVYPDPASSPSAPLMRIEFPDADAVRKVGIDWKQVEAHDLAESVTASSMLDYEPSRYAQLTSRASGTVWHVEKEIGDKLHKGDVLAVIEAAEVGQAKAAFLQSLTQVKARTLVQQRLEAAGKVGSVSERTLLDAETAVREARIRLFNDQQALLNLGLPIRLPDVEPLSDEQAVRHLRLLGLPEAITNKFKQEILTANLLPLKAPFDGQVVQRNVAVGEVVQPTQTKSLFVVADLTRMHIEMFVKPEDMTEVSVGLTATFRPDGASADVASGKVSHIGPEVEEKTRRVRVHAEFDNPGGKLRPNTFGTAHILIREHHQVPVVPSEAVQANGSEHLVFVRMSETTFQARPVRLGLREGNLVEVSGVAAGEKVVTTGSFLLKSQLQRDRIISGD
jgi:cobalt-zinc-cadmium efflux system membrane fusion protein